VIDESKILQLLDKTPLFRGIPHKLLAPIFRQAILISLEQGEKLLSPGNINEHVYIIISGQMGVHLALSNPDEPFATLNPGECVGEMSVLVDRIVSAYVIAKTDCQLLAIGYSSFWSLIKGSNESARNMLNILVQRIRMGNEVIAETLSQHDKLHGKKALIDSLTGLYSDYGMQEIFDRMLHTGTAAKQPFCLIILEADVEIDTSGSAVKLSDEQPLHAIAQTILTFLRPGDYAARLSGNRFAMLLVNSSISDASATAERLRATICQTRILLPDGSSLPPVTVSAGVCKVNADDSWSTLIAKATQAFR
jgi:diguanylate cyclase (GGDEF)-like protein